MEDNFMMTTLEHIPNLDIEEHIGLVSGTYTVHGRGWKRLLNRLKNFFGGESQEIDQDFMTARDAAVAAMKQEAIKRGGTAIINIRFESLRLSDDYCEIHVYGTAVKAHSF